jgi:YVTN family beta-propeller protein
MTRLAGVLGASLLVACGSERTPAVSSSPQTHSASMVASPDGSRLFIVHPDADAISIVDARARRVLQERTLADRPPRRDAGDRYEPSVAPRALARNATATRLYVTGERSGRLYVLDAASAKVVADAFVCSEPVGVVVSADDERVFVACSADAELVELSADDLSLVSRVSCPSKPWALAWSEDGETVLSTHLLGPGVSQFKTGPLVLAATWALEDGPPRPGAEPDPKEPHGVVRGIYDAMVRPGTSELWVAHSMLGIDTPQPELDFERTVFPALSILSDAGAELARLSVHVHPGDGGAFGDVVSGPHALDFSSDGRFALVADAHSEDLLVVDADRRVQTALVRPLPGHMPEAVVWTDQAIYVQQRNTEDVSVFHFEESGGRASVVSDGPAFASLSRDPMPAELRLGQKLFYSADSDDVPVTQNHWVACASCHLEGRSDAVTWQFTQGPRDTPSNAGGLLDTGFLFRTADRTRVEDYWRTINIEQGGHFSGDDPSQAPLLSALAAFVNYAIPAPVPPSSDATHSVEGAELAALRNDGESVFTRVGCGRCHSGPAKTDSGAGNPSLDLGGPVVSSEAPGGVLLHEVGTCSPDELAMGVSHEDVAGHPRAPCAFDTPQLRGLDDSAPYFHGGSAATLDDVLPSMLVAGLQAGDPVPVLSAEDRRALIEYLRGL